MERSSTWKQKNRRRPLLIALIVAIIIGLCLAIALGVVNNKGPAEDTEVCYQPECIHTASNVLKWMDPTVDPCDNFYNFACGNFVEKSTIPDDESSVSTSSISNDLILEQLKTIIEKPIRPREPKPFVHVKKLYKACMNKTLIAQINLAEIKEMIDYFGGWPVLEGEKWNRRIFDWKNMIYKFDKRGFYSDYFLSFLIDTDTGNSSRRIISIDQPFLVLSKEYLTGHESVFPIAYYNYMTDIAVLFGADKTRAEEEMHRVLEFETNLAEISDAIENRRDTNAMYNPRTIDELVHEYPNIPWLDYINELLSPYEKVTRDEVVIISSLKFVQGFNNLINNVTRRTLANYLIWRTVASAMTYLPDKFRKRQLQFSTVLSGETEMLPRWKECTSHCLDSLNIAANALYVRNYFKKEARNNAKELVSNIRTEFKETLKKVDWMDKKTKQLALEKANMMVSHIAYPIELLNDKKIEEYYEGLEINESSYLTTWLNVSIFTKKSSYKKLRLPVNKTDWTTHSNAATVNAFYSPNENSIQFPAGILQGVYFNNDRPSYMNYGGIGFIIGHEITHGFDDEGKRYNADGSLENWWVQETEAAFLKKAQCIVSHFGTYILPEIGQKLNGISTLGENIADLGGIKQAYLAYDRLINENGEEPTLPGLDYNGRQLFWISAANTWCSKTRPEVLKQNIADDVHTPDRFRILGTFSNMPEFAKDFECSSGSRMNPEYKCKLW